ncbi:hypothetical protein A1O1_06875 [Capronia coronata CBS 617.96]|uniref:Mitochondrial intermembrane space import and assembly protein 40 n=1 Tax=Capronia coronata CBS 617.96 TaxID=1182541 RepID=W9Y1Z0_9EURO|nr:uncharacterized protein A1O1_06875 [Capronia coronata CBS 617.96]EXJ83256.1 hypothetical protein A1O1_06875 [Capronia coronata CBS 617.96]
MFRPAARSLVRTAIRPGLVAPRTAVGRRFVSTSPVDARRSWKSTLFRWGIAIAGIYYYNTSPVFAEQPQNNLLNPNLDAADDIIEESPLEALTSRRQRQPESNSAVLHAAADAVSSENASTSVAAQEQEPLSTGSAGELEEEAANEGAFNPETGEINWDCPCLGGMAHGPCGPEFREAFSCFVFSTEEPKGMDCIDKFQNMQQCFQRYPEVYKGELEDDEELDAGLEAEKQELVNEIKERKAQQQQRQQGQDTASQRRLLEEPASASSKPAQSDTKASASPREKTTSSENKPASTSQEIPKTTSQDQPRPAYLESSKMPQEEAKVKVHDDPTMSEERELIHEGQASITVREPNPPPVRDEFLIDEASIIPKAAHDATSGSAKKKRETEK